MLIKRFHFRITPECFVSASEEIETLFPNENKHTYYIPYVPKTHNSPKIPPKGKLYSKYVNLRACLNHNPGKTVTSNKEADNGNNE